MIKNSHRLATALALAVVCFLSTNPADAKSVTFQREYTYQASEADSKLNCRAIALEQVKRLLLEELGTYLESETEVRDYQLTKDQITTFTAGIVQTEIVDEKWDGKEYWLKARIVADPDQMVKSIDALRKDREKTKELEGLRGKAEHALMEVERLRKELASLRAKPNARKKAEHASREVERLNEPTTFMEWLASKQADKKRQYNAHVKTLTVTDWHEKGSAFEVSGEYNEAIKAWTMAIELDPRYAPAYKGLGNAHYYKGQYDRAIEDYTKALELDPRGADNYYNRGLAYYGFGNNQQAKKDWIVAARLGNRRAANILNKQGIEWQ